MSPKPVRGEPGPTPPGVPAGLLQGVVGVFPGGGGTAGPEGSADPLVAVGSLGRAGPVSGSGRGPRGSSPAPRDPAS
ncbi:hypothetical protein [Microbispora hainanensis]|uniref:hypothetical protein n=1 Tax=Microbispora hainanensis TaxID=568844 RepID=UPI001ABEF4CE|nr:hypothetical protein [Microbispora hainanensis]